MLKDIVLKEMKFQFKSLTFWVFTGIVVLFYLTNYIGDGDSRIIMPKNYEEGDWLQLISDESEIIAKARNQLMRVIEVGSVTAYRPFAKNIKLDEVQREKIRVFLDKEMTLDSLKVLLDELNIELGGNTVFSESHRFKYYRGMTLEEYKLVYRELEEEKFTPAFARILSDYLGISIIMFLGFVSAFVIRRDKKSSIQELIYSSKVKGVIYISGKFVGVFLAVMTVILAIIVFETIVFIQDSVSNNLMIDYTGFLKVGLVFLVPTIMLSIAVPFLLSIVFRSSIVAAIIQFVIGLATIILSSLSGEYHLFNPIIRFNALGDYDLFLSNLNTIITNRLFITGLSIIIVIISGMLWERTRKNVIGKR